MSDVTHILSQLDANRRAAEQLLPLDSNVDPQARPSPERVSTSQKREVSSSKSLPPRNAREGRAQVDFRTGTS
jgi:hypothetical protein